MNYGEKQYLVLEDSTLRDDGENVSGYPGENRAMSIWKVKIST